MAIGKCKECGYSPVAAGARDCPKCGKRNPNPTVTDRITGRSMLIGLFLGVLVFGAIGFFHVDKDGSTGGIAGAIAFGLMGGIAGLALGIMGGFCLSIFAWLLRVFGVGKQSDSRSIQS